MPHQVLALMSLMLLLPAVPVAAQSPSAMPLASAVPAELQPAIAARFGDGSAGTPATVTLGETTIELWWVSGVEPYAAGEPGWSMVDQGALVGAMRVTGAFKEVRGRTIAPGVYTLRYGRQPQNGDHLGVSLYRDFLMMSQAELDTDPADLGYDVATKLSAQAIGTSHPAALSLDPPEQAAEPALTAYTSEDGLEGVVVEAPFAFEGQPLGTLRFGLILVGTIVH